VRLRFSFVVALLVLALLTCLSALRPHPASSAHACAPSIPPPVPGPLVPAPATPGIVLINEVLYVPATTWNCSDQGKPSDRTDSWVELYNPTRQAFDLHASRASFDSSNSPSPYNFPLGTAIAPLGYLVLFPDAHTNLLAPGANLSFTINGVSIDRLTIPTLGDDQSYARVPDGKTTWQITISPTIDASNTLPELTPTTTSTSHHNGSGSGGGNYGSGTGDQSTSTLINGTQPPWSKLQLPTSVPISTATVSQSLTITSPPPTTNSISDTPHRILLTILIVAMASMLFWCWRLFRPS
jgi:hypothetical protein